MNEFSPKTTRALLKYGTRNCVRAFYINEYIGEGAYTIALTMASDDKIRTTRQADAAVNAGAEYAEVRGLTAADLRAIDEGEIQI